MNSDTGKSLIIQTPLILTWGANKFVDEKSGKETYDMALQFPRDDYQTEDNKKFLDAMVTLQNKLKDDAITNSKEWFNKPKMSREVVDALFHPMLSYSKDKETGEPDMTKSPTLKVKIPFWENNFNCEVYDTNAKMLFPPSDPSSSVTPLELITKASNIIAVIQCGGFWFANGKFGVTWKLIQCVVKPKPTLKGRCLIAVSSDAKSQIEKTTVASPAANDDEEEQQATSTAMQIVEDSEEEEDNENKVETLPAPVLSAAPVVVEEPKAAEPAAVPVAIKKEVKRIVKKKD
jgi:hypothetical protein